LERLLDQAKKSVVLHQRRARTPQIELAPVNDVEALLHVCAATKKQRKDCGKQGFHARCPNEDARAFPESAKSVVELSL
jgi:hypothetical protein